MAASAQPSGAGRSFAVIGEAFRVAREREGLTLAELAGRAGIAESRLAGIEAGKGQLPSLIMLRLLEALEYGLDYGGRGEDSEFARLGATFRMLRQARGISLAELAASSGLNKKAIERIEQGLGNPLHATLQELAEALGSRLSFVYSAAEIFGGAEVEHL